MRTQSQTNKGKTPLVIAHRGASGEAPENTGSAFLLAIEQQCDMIELDIQLTTDGQFIICHDEDVSRTTSGTGMIHELTLSELRQLDAGSWFGPSFAGERLLLLKELFEFIPPAISLNIEVKTPLNDLTQAQLIRLIREYHRTHTAVISSFDHKLLYRLKKAAPDIRIGLLYIGKLTHPLQLVRQFELEVHSLHPYYPLIDPEDIQALRASGLQTYAWTVNDPEAMQRLIDAQVSGIITDYPARMRELLRKAKEGDVIHGQ